MRSRRACGAPSGILPTLRGKESTHAVCAKASCVSCLQGRVVTHGVRWGAHVMPPSCAHARSVMRTPTLRDARLRSHPLSRYFRLVSLHLQASAGRTHGNDASFDGFVIWGWRSVEGCILAIARLHATTAELVVCGPDGARRFGVHSFVGKESLPQACLVCRCWLWRYSASFFGWMRLCSLVALWHTGRRMSLYRLDRFDGLRQHRERLCISIVLGAVAACYPPIWAHTLMWHLASTTDGRPPRLDGERTR